MLCIIIYHVLCYGAAKLENIRIETFNLKEAEEEKDRNE
jgi:hypothetical protein